MGSQADLWKDLEKEFRRLAHEELGRARAFSPEFRQPEPHNRSLRKLRHAHLLHANYDYNKHPETGLWKLNCGAFAVGENLLERFRALAARAGAALGPPKDTDAEDWWLHRLRRDLRENRSWLFPKGADLTSMLQGDELTGNIVRVCEASATFCARLERKAVSVAAPADQRMISAPAKAEAAESKSTNKQQKPLEDHELKIWEVIQRGAKGLQYCRELGESGIAPSRSGIWKGCPRTYASAYRQGEPWRHRIQDEKSKIRRKAELAGLAKLASE